MNLIDLIENISPSSGNEVTAVSTTDANWTSITLDDNAVFIDVSLSGDSAHMVCKSGTPTGTDTGCIYLASIPVRLPCKRATKLWIRRSGSTDVTAYVTEYISTSAT